MPKNGYVFRKKAVKLPQRPETLRPDLSKCVSSVKNVLLFWKITQK